MLLVLLRIGNVLTQIDVDSASAKDLDNTAPLFGILNDAELMDRNEAKGISELC